MRGLIFLFLFVINGNCYSQILLNQKEIDLYGEIQKQTEVPFEHVGFAGQNRNFLIIDSFKNLVGIERFVSFRYDSSYSLKYWAFITLLQENDSMAFEFLKSQITNDTRVYFRFPGCELTPTPRKFNIALIDIYECVIRLRYKEGNSGTISAILFLSKGKNKKKWKNLQANLNKLIEDNGIEIKPSMHCP